MIDKDQILLGIKKIVDEKYLKLESARIFMGRLLVVDDHKILLETLKDILGDRGHEVSTVSSGRMALEELSKHQFDLALIDLKLEDISGFDVMEVIKKEYPNVIVIVLTGFASLDSAVKALRLGAYDFLQKPIRPEFLLKAVERGLEKRQLKQLSEAVIRKMDEGLALLDSEGVLEFMNQRFPEMLKYSPEELAGKSFLSVVSPEDEHAVIHCLKRIHQDNPQRIEASLIRKDGVELVAIISFTDIGDQTLSVTSDITKIVSPSPTISSEDFTYMTEPGHIYLVGEEKTEKSLEAFIDLVRAGYKGTIVTREHPDEIRTKWKIDVPIFRLTEELSGDSALFPDVSLIEKRIVPHFSRNRAVLIDRLDYLISTNSFELVLSLIQRVRDLIFMKKSIIILSVDPRTLTEREFSLLEKETSPLLLSSKPELREDLLELLGYVAKRNEVGAKPHHKEIGKRFNITRTTVRQRLKLLHDKGLIVERKKGRTKIVEITDKGRKVLFTS